MLRIADDAPSFRFTYRADNLSRNAQNQLARGYFLPLGDQRSGTDNRTCTDVRSVQDPGAHPDKAIFFDGTSVHDSPMSNRHSIADIKRESVGGHMQNRTILDITSLADTDPVYITPDNCLEPETGVVPGSDIADDDSRGCDENIVPKLGLFLKMWKSHGVFHFRSMFNVQSLT